MLTAEAMPRSFAARSLPFATSSAAFRSAPGRQELCCRCDDPLRRSCLPAGLPEPREMRRHEGDHLELEAVRRSHRLGIALHLEQRSLELFCLPLDPRFLLALAGFQPPIAVAERER